MRLNLLVAALAGLVIVGCAGDDEVTDGTDAPVDTADDGNNSAERLGVPDEYKFLWNTQEACTTADGADGVNVYWHADDAQSVEIGTRLEFTATETWYWFHGGSGSADCKDVWEITGQWVTTDYAQLGCEGCEEAWYFRRELVDQGCQYQYHQLFGFGDNDDPPEEPIYEGYLLFDTHNEFNDAPNENNKLLMVARYRTPSGFVLNNNYNATGMSRREVDDPERIGPPGNYVWVGEACVGSGGGDGGGA